MFSNYEKINEELNYANSSTLSGILYITLGWRVPRMLLKYGSYMAQTGHTAASVVTSHTTGSFRPVLITELFCDKPRFRRLSSDAVFTKKNMISIKIRLQQRVLK